MLQRKLRHNEDMPKRKLTHKDYTVGWISPLEVEMPDEEHERLL
jgi:hypothetical protein